MKVRARTTELGPEETKEAATEQQQPSAPPLNLQLTYALERSLSFQWEPVDCSQRHGEIVNYEYEIVGLDDWAKLERQIANTSNLQVTIDGLTPFTKYVMRKRFILEYRQRTSLFRGESLQQHRGWSQH